MEIDGSIEIATLGGGCFWCIEAVYSRVKGVHSAISGYAGGVNPNPTYREVCSHTTGHAEVVQVEYDPARVSYDDLLDAFRRRGYVDDLDLDAQIEAAVKQRRQTMAISSHDE